MRHGRLFLAVFTILATAIFGSSASAETLSISHKIKITAVVLPATYILTNSSGQILEIGSNTTQDVAPQVYVNRIDSSNMKPLEPNVYKEFRKLVPSGQVHPGVLYKRPNPVAFASSHQIRI